MIDWFAAPFIKKFSISLITGWLVIGFDPSKLKSTLLSIPPSFNLLKRQIEFISSSLFMNNSKSNQHETKTIQELLKWSWWALEERQLITRKFKEKKQTQQTNKTNAFIWLCFVVVDLFAAPEEERRRQESSSIQLSLLFNHHNE